MSELCPLIFLLRRSAQQFYLDQVSSQIDNFLENLQTMED